jgi:hypothetical protein
MNSLVKIVESADEAAMLLAWCEAERESMENRGLHVPANPTPEEARKVLEEARGTRDGERGMFGGWPDDVDWFRATATVEEIGAFWHCGYRTFRWLTDETRFPRDSATNLNDPPFTDGEIQELIENVPKVASAIEQGEEMEPIIVVALDKTSQPIIAEGNKRSIAFQLAYSSDKEIEFLFGTSPNIDGWRFYNFA